MDHKPERLCPICQRPNDRDAERCWYCQAVLSQVSQEKKGDGTDWLEGLREESEQAAEAMVNNPPSQENIEQPEEVPDWLTRIRTREQMERENLDSSGKQEPAGEKTREDIPAWLKEIKAGNSGSKPDNGDVQPDQTPIPPFETSNSEEESVSLNQEDDDTDEWLNKLAAWQPSEPAQQEGKPADIIGNEPKLDKSEQYRGVNDQILQSPLDANATPAETPFESPGLDQSRGWQKIFPDETKIDSQEQSDIKIVVTPDHSEPGLDLNSLRQDLTSQNKQPDRADENLSEEITGNEETADFDKPDGPESLFTTESESVDSETGQGLFDKLPFVTDDLPDWLTTATINKQVKTGELITEEPGPISSDQDHHGTKLPAWLQAIRPSAPEAFTEINENSAQIDEEKGLLAGISGTLHSPESKVDFRKPLGYGSALKVSQHDKTNAALFAGLVEDTFENEEESSPKKGKASRVIFQLLLGIILFGIMLYSKTNLTDYAIQPALFAPEVVAVFNTINTLPTDKPVLLTADFEAATYGELSWSSQTLLEHLMRRNLNIVLVSTDPAGTTMLYQQLLTVNQKISSYDLDTQLINLGFLAGGSTGLQFMSGNLRSALPYTHDFEEAWRSPYLESVQSLNDFGAVIVMSDNAEHARFWIEQIEPDMKNTPLMYVVSAQVAPLLQPYYQSGQISGFIAGFNGSLTYEKVFSQQSDSSAHLSSYQAALLFMAFLILAGGLIALVRPESARRKG